MSENALVDLLNGLVERIFLLDDRTVDALPLLNELALGMAESSECLLAEFHGLEHVLFGDLLSTGLDHGDEVAAAAELKIEIGVLALFVRGVNDELAGLRVACDANAGKRPLEGNAAERHGERGAHDVDDVERVDLVGDEGSCHDVDLVAETVGEARADRTVDHACGKRGLLGRTALALEVTAGNATGGVHLLVEIDRKREEVVVLALLGDDNGVEHGGVALLDEDGSGCLLCKLTGLEDVRLAVQLEGLGYECHVSLFQPPHATLRTGFFLVLLAPAEQNIVRHEVTCPYIKRSALGRSRMYDFYWMLSRMPRALMSSRYSTMLFFLM